MKDVVITHLTGHGLWLPALALAFAGVLVFLVASHLARAADAIADTTRLGRAWIGVVLLAGSTSLPEIATDVNAALLDLPDIGVGDLIGSTLANMLILGLLDLFYARRQILQTVATNHTVVAMLAIALTVIAAIAIAVGGFGRLGPIGIETAIITALYLVGMRVFYRLTRPPPGGLIPDDPEAARAARTRRARLRRALWTFGAAATVLLAVAPFLVMTAEAFSIESGLSETFVGTLLVGLTTSFPELAATVAAVRLGAIDLAVGNIFGSNAFNMCVLLFMDLAYGGAPLLASVSQDHLLTSLLAVLCMALGVLAILGRLERPTAALRLESILIVAAYAGGVWLLATS